MVSSPRFWIGGKNFNISQINKGKTMASLTEEAANIMAHTRANGGTAPLVWKRPADSTLWGDAHLYENQQKEKRKQELQESRVRATDKFRLPPTDSMGRPTYINQPTSRGLPVLNAGNADDDGGLANIVRKMNEDKRQNAFDKAVNEAVDARLAAHNLSTRSPEFVRSKPETLKGFVPGTDRVEYSNYGVGSSNGVAAKNRATLSPEDPGYEEQLRKNLATIAGWRKDSKNNVDGGFDDMTRDRKYGEQDPEYNQGQHVTEYRRDNDASYSANKALSQWLRKNIIGLETKTDADKAGMSWDAPETFAHDCPEIVGQDDRITRAITAMNAGRGPDASAVNQHAFEKGRELARNSSDTYRAKIGAGAETGTVGDTSFDFNGDARPVRSGGGYSRQAF
jgi:hypothetical protein